MFRLSFKAGFLSVFLLTSILLFLRFGDYFSFEKGMVIEAYGDGFKAYMSPAWHALYDSTWSHFGGMHYPYGDHLVMSDPQPLLANMAKAIGPKGTAGIQAVIDWTHLVMLGSILCSALFLYLLFHRLQLPGWFSVLSSIALSFMAPMVARMGYHFGLAQPAALSVVLYLLLRFQERPAWKWSALIAVSVIFFSLFHFHYFGLFVLGLSLYYLVDIVIQAKVAYMRKVLPHYVVQVLLPFGLLYSWLNSGSAGLDRASQPWGFLFYKARLEGLFTSADQPHWQWFDRWVSPLPELDVEAVNYIGLVAGVFVVLTLVIQLRSGFRRRIFPVEQPGSGFLRRLFLSSVLLLLFALGIPFIIPPFQDLLRFMGPLQQFRALGRFSWYFFYAANISGLAWWAYILRSKPWFLVVPIAVLSVEALYYIQARDLKLDPVPGLLAEESMLQRALQHRSDYQSMFTIPFFHLGSESFWWEPTGGLQQEGMVLALRSGLPLHNAMLSRTPLSQTLRQLQLASEPYRAPAILGDLPDQRPLLLLYDREAAARQSPLWDHVKNNLDSFGMELVYVQGAINVYKVPLDFFYKNLKNKEIQVFTELTSPELTLHNGYLSKNSGLPFVVASFDSLHSENSYKGNGGFQGIGKKENLIYTWKIPQESKHVGYTISCWYFAQADLRSRSVVFLRERDSTGRLVQEQSYELHRQSVVFDSNGWVLAELPFTPGSSEHTLEVVVQNRLIGAAPLYLDELVIRPATMDLYAQKGAWIWKNNRFYRRAEEGKSN